LISSTTLSLLGLLLQITDLAKKYSTASSKEKTKIANDYEQKVEQLQKDINECARAAKSIHKYAQTLYYSQFLELIAEVRIYAADDLKNGKTNKTRNTKAWRGPYRLFKIEITSSGAQALIKNHDDLVKAIDNPEFLNKKFLSAFSIHSFKGNFKGMIMLLKEHRDIIENINIQFKQGATPFSSITDNLNENFADLLGHADAAINDLLNMEQVLLNRRKLS